jgi:aspartate-semialdehyde dehydrogenase
MKNKLRAGVIGATGYVGQRFVTLLSGHPWFETVLLAASPRSAGQTYAQAVAGRWKIDRPIPQELSGQIVRSTADLDDWADAVDFVFCAVDMKKDEIRALEERIARLEIPVVSNNSAHRWTPDVPVIIPEVNPDHTALIEFQRRRLGTRRGFITAKPNCSIQSYVPALTPLMDFSPEQISVCTYQAISGAGKTFADWPEMKDNLIPYIGGEEEKSEQEPLKIWGTLSSQGIIQATRPLISAQCYRIAVQEGHTAAVSVKFTRKPPQEEMIDRWQEYRGQPQLAGLPSAPQPFLVYRPEADRPQPLLDAMTGAGMAVTIGRLRPDNLFDYRFTCLSHNTIRGAAGGAILTAELLVYQGYLTAR